MKGLDLSRRYFEELGLSALRNHFPEYLDRAACGLIGPGSDVFGYDDEISRDHNWGPRFWIVLSSEDYAEVGERMEKTLFSEVPPEFEGHQIREFPPGKGERHVRVWDVRELCESVLGYAEVPQSDVEWLGIAEHRLFELQAGEVWHDPQRLLIGLREQTSYFPEMVWRKRMAFFWEALFFADNFVRCAVRGERVGEQMYLGWALFCLMRLTFMLNRRYAPYRKWLHRAFRELPRLVDELDPLLARMTDGESAKVKGQAFRAALDLLGQATNELGIIEPQALEGEPAYLDSSAGFNCYGFATAIQGSITGPLSKLAYHDGAPDQWAFDLGTAKPPQFPEVVRALFPKAWNRGEGEQQPMVTIKDVGEAARELGLSGHPLCVHASLRSFGWVDGGASAVVDGLLAEGCTVMVPTFSWTFAVPPPRARPARNAWDYDDFQGPTSGIGRVYSPDTMEMDEKDMGAVAAGVAAMPGRVRGNHPLCSFTAVGPLAHELICGQEPLNVWAPLKALGEANGSVVLMGVGFERMTFLHLAEQMAGRNPFRRWANGPDGQTMEVEAGGCSDGFGGFERILSAAMKELEVGESLWRAFPAKEALELAARAIRENPRITHCGNSECGRCNDAVAGGPIIDK